MPIAGKSRYVLEEGHLDNQPTPYIRRRDVPNGNRLYMPRGYSIDQEVLARPDHPHNRIYLDGAAKGPYYDPNRGIFSLDHHELCIRQITDAACIQAIQLARARIIDVAGNDIIGNEPDGDTVFAAWAALNPDLIAHDDKVFHRVLPLFTLEGNIDTYGIGYEEFTALPTHVILEARRQIESICRDEQIAKRKLEWADVDFTDLTQRELCKFDKLVLSRDKMDAAVRFAAQQSYPLRNNKTVHFAQTADAGIYETEHAITPHHNKCACIVLFDGRGKWTIKLTGYLNQYDLSPVWERLNVLETEYRITRGVQDPAMLNATWGGGNTMGGSPRYRNGMGPFVPGDVIMQNIVGKLDEQALPNAARTVT